MSLDENYRSVEAPTPVFHHNAGQPYNPAVALPPGWTMESLEDFSNAIPAHVSGTLVFEDDDSFAAYLNRFVVPGQSMIFANRAKKQVMAKLDYHQSPSSPAADKHRAIRKYTLDRRFMEWSNRNKTPFSQRVFAEFLEERMLDVFAPSHGELMSCVVNFKAHLKSTLLQAVDLTTGDTRFEFANETKNDKGSAVLPDKLTIRLPIFEFCTEWDIQARLRHAITTEGKLTFTFELLNIEDVVNNALLYEISKMSSRLSTTILLAAD